jgi:hypothetical protein
MSKDHRHIVLYSFHMTRRAASRCTVHVSLKSIVSRCSFTFSFRARHGLQASVVFLRWLEGPALCDMFSRSSVSCLPSALHKVGMGKGVSRSVDFACVIHLICVANYAGLLTQIQADWNFQTADISNKWAGLVSLCLMCTRLTHDVEADSACWLRLVSTRGHHFSIDVDCTIFDPTWIRR